MRPTSEASVCVETVIWNSYIQHMLAGPFDFEKTLQCNMKEWHTTKDV